MKRIALVAIAVCVGGAVAGLFVARSHGSRAHKVFAVSPANAGQATPKASIVRSTEDARALFMRASTRMGVGLTAADVAATERIYRFADGIGNFAAGLGVYRAPLPNGGFCLAFASAVGCTHVPPSGAEPLIGVGLDPDAERAGEPFVLISLKAPEVRSVTYTCGGKTYAATIAGAVVTFVAPSSSVRADDCTENATLASGKVVSKTV
jgi:hypothetical protein